ncbi:DUF2069 domain-containing protein [Lysobacter humi (ex Lee et al. 2017)]
MTPAHRLLVAALLALVALYGAWFGPQRDIAAVLVFGVPPLLLAMGVQRGASRAGFWAGVLALAWFSHGIMVAWTRPAELGHALVEIALSLVVVGAASLPGLRSRFGARRGTRL